MLQMKYAAVGAIHESTAKPRILRRYETLLRMTVRWHMLVGDGVPDIPS